MKFDITSIVFLFGALQCAFLIIGINIKRPFYSDLKKIASLLLLSFLCVMVYYVLVFSNTIHIPRVLHPLSSAFWMSIPPLYYLLFMSIHVGEWQLVKRHIGWFVIPLLFLVESFLVLFYNWGFIYRFCLSITCIMDIWMFLFLSSSLFYVYKTILIFRKDEDDQYGNGLIWFSYFLLASILFSIVTYIIIRRQYVVLFETSLIFLFLVLIVSLILRGFRVLSIRHLYDVPKFSDSTTKSKMQSFASKLEMLMENQKPYLRQKLSLHELSELSGIKTSDLSQLINTHYRSSYYEFINKYRLDHVESLLSDPAYRQYKIIALAEESGFASKATFYKVFKAKHQLTPLQYMKRMKD